MRVSEILNELNDGKKLEDISKPLSVNSRKIGKALRSIGYSYDRSTKKWIYNDVSIFELIQRSQNESQHVHIQEDIVTLPKWINEQFEQFAKKTQFDKSALLQLAVLELMNKHTNGKCL